MSPDTILIYILFQLTETQKLSWFAGCTMVGRRQASAHNTRHYKPYKGRNRIALDPYCLPRAFHGAKRDSGRDWVRELRSRECQAKEFYWI